MLNLFVSCPKGLEKLLRQELISLQIDGTFEGKGGVHAPLKIQDVFKINYCSRIATRVLWPIASFPCPDKNALYTQIRRIPWQYYLNLKKTFSIDPNVNHPNLRNSLFAAMVVKDAICDFFRDKTGSRPDVQVNAPDVQLNLYIDHNHATLSIDTSGEPLFKRGYRQDTFTAPIQESLASAILSHCNYSPDDIFCDPFCGSGTFLIEAAMTATDTPAGFYRKTWGFKNLPEYQENEWVQFRKNQDGKRKSYHGGKIFGSDIDPMAIEICKKNIQSAGFEDIIDLERKDIKSYFPEFSPTKIICNPPYGKRIKFSENIYQALGQFLKTNWTPSLKAFCLSPDLSLVKQTDLEPSKVMSLKNGGLDIGLYNLTAF